MFLCAVSNNNRNQTEDPDVASVFTGGLEQPIKLKDFTIELVDCVITANNYITITSTNNTFVFRMGDESVSEQYLGKIPPGRYDTDELCELLKTEIINLIPITAWRENGLKYFSVIFSSNKFIITYTADPSVALPKTLHLEKLQKNLNTLGYEFEMASVGATELFVGSKFTDDGNFNNEPMFTETNREVFDNLKFKNSSLTGLDVGENLQTLEADYVDERTLASFSNTGIQEDGGKMQVILSTSLCVEKSAYCSPSLDTNNFNGYYFIIENNTRGTIYDNTTFTESFLNPRSKTRLRTSQLGQEYVSGIFIQQNPNSTGDIRGAPYNLEDATMWFPVNDRADFNGAGDLTGNKNRIEKIHSTWNGSFRVRQKVTTNLLYEYNSYNHFNNRGFNLDIVGGDNPENRANSSLSLESSSKEPITIRLARSPLIAGLRQGNNAGNADQTKITETSVGGTESILTNQSNTHGDFKLEYIVGSVGQYNSTNYISPGLAASLSDQTCLDGRFPFYKITGVNADNKPTIIFTTDGGEGVDPTLTQQALILSDPKTFKIIRISTGRGVTNQISQADKDAVLQNCGSFITPTTANVGASSKLFTTKYQFLPTSISIANDMIYNNVDINNQQLRELKAAETANFAKDMRLKLVPRDSKGTSPNDSIELQVEGFVPSTAEYNDEDHIISQFQNDPENTTGMSMMFFDSSPGSWDTDVTYTPTRTLNRWTGFIQNSATTKLRLTLEINNFYEFSAKCAYDVGAGFVQETTLIKTFETATINGTTLADCDCTAKSRLFPYHPCIASFPSNALGQSFLEFSESNLNDYPDKIENGQILSNYEFKRSRIPNNSINTPSIFVFPANQTAIGGAALNYAPMMFKFGSNIEATTTPTLADTGKLEAIDIPPVNRQMMSKPTDFADSYIAESADYTGATPTSTLRVLTIDGGTSPNFTAKIDTFVVEIANLNAEGYITYGFNRDGGKMGTGVASQIVGVVPYLKEKEITSVAQTEYQTLQYSTPYSQPVTINLPTTRYVYNFDFRLRNITTGTYVKGLLNPTQLIFRVQPLISN